MKQQTKQNANCSTVGTSGSVSNSCNQAQNNINVNNGGIKTTGKQVPTTGTLTVIKHVINDNGGSSTAKDFTISVSRSFPGAESPGTDVTLTPGPFSVSETGPTGYTKSLSGDCSGTINPGDNKVCTITNNDKPQTGGPSISVSNVWCAGKEFTGEPILGVQVNFGGISHDSHYTSFTLQYYLPDGNLLRTAFYEVPDTLPDPYSAGSTVGLPVPPGPTAGTYKIVMVVFYDYNNAVSTTFQAPECSQS